MSVLKQILDIDYIIEKEMREKNPVLSSLINLRESLIDNEIENLTIKIKQLEILKEKTAFNRKI